MTLLVPPENVGSACVGTDVAILCKSAAASLPSLSRNTWGGARNNASRESGHIKPEKAVELVEAAQVAMSLGLPFNRHLTVHWAKAGLVDAQAAAATGRMMKLIRDWARKRGGRIAYAWVRETGPGKGTHSHILLHVPDGLTLAFTRRWYRLATHSTGKVPKGAVNSARIGGTTRAGLSASEWYQANLARLLSYLLKGTDPATAARLGLTEYGDGGRIVGKRIAISIGTKVGPQ